MITLAALILTAMAAPGVIFITLLLFKDVL